VSDQELTDWVYGENPPEDLKRNFIDSTVSSTGICMNRFSGIQPIYHRPPRLRSQLRCETATGVREQLRLRRIQEKLQSVVGASVRVTDGEARQSLSTSTNTMRQATPSSILRCSSRTAMSASRTPICTHTTTRMWTSSI